MGRCLTIRTSGLPRTPDVARGDVEATRDPPHLIRWRRRRRRRAVGWRDLARHDLMRRVADFVPKARAEGPRVCLRRRSSSWSPRFRDDERRQGLQHDREVSPLPHPLRRGPWTILHGLGLMTRQAARVNARTEGDKKMAGKEKKREESDLCSRKKGRVPPSRCKRHTPHLTPRLCTATARTPPLCARVRTSSPPRPPPPRTRR